LKNQSSRLKENNDYQDKSMHLSLPYFNTHKKIDNYNFLVKEQNTFAQEKKKNSTLFHPLRDSRTPHRKINRQSRNTDLKVKNKKYYFLNYSKVPKSFIEKLYKFFQLPGGKRAKTAELI